MKKKNHKRKFATDATKPALKKTNPFEIHINRSKYNVLGRQCKSDMGLPGVSKNKALQKRKKTLLQEYKMKGKSNHFIDQRIGEQTTGMTEEDRIMARFTAERMRMFNKKAMFNLSDSEVLTHRGQTLSEIERFEDTRSDDEDEEPGNSGALKRKFVAEAHFGGGTLKKSNKDRESLIDELIIESKKRKAERQKNKEDTLEATEQLDEDWKTLGVIVTSTKETDEVLAKESHQKNENYDVVMRQLKFEPHGQASQRLKTDEEIAREDKEQLEKLEKERLKMLREVEAVKYKTHKSADDLDDGFSYALEGLRDDGDQNGSDGENSDVSSEHDAEEKSEEECDGSENEEEVDYEKEDLDNLEKQQEEFCQSELENCVVAEAEDETNTKQDCSDPSSNEESSDDEDCAMDDLTDLMPCLDTTSADSIKLLKEQSRNSEQNIGDSEDNQGKYTSTNTEKSTKFEVELDLPYVIKVPESYDLFKALVSTYTVPQLNVIFERLIKSNHPSLEPDNKKKMLTLAEYVIQLVNEGDVTWEAIPTLVLHFSHIKEFNREPCLVSLAEIFAELSIDSIPSLPNLKLVVWYTLLFLKPEGMEVLLPISKPALTLACKITAQTDSASTDSIVIGLLCSYLLLQDAKNSSVVYTDTITFLQQVMNDALKMEIDSPKISKKKLRESQKYNKKQEGIPEDLKILVSQLDSGAMCVSGHQILCYCAVLLSGFIKAYRKYPQSKILFRPLQNTLNQIQEDRYPAALKQEVVDLKGLIQVLQTSLLPSLAKAAKKPKALRQYEPSFHTLTISKFQRGLPAEKQEEQKLLHKYKQEKKGAMRELRRDRSFLANIKLKEKAVSDEQRIRKVKEIFGDAAAQQGEFRKLKRKK